MVDALCGQHSLVEMALDRLPNTCTTHAQAVLDSVPYAFFGALGREGQQLLDALLAGQFDELRLTPQRELGIVPLAGDGVFVREERVRGGAILDRVRPCRGRQDLVWRILGQEALQSWMQLLRELDVAHVQRHLDGGNPFVGSPTTARKNCAR